MAVFLASLSQMGGNAHIAGRVLRGMADSVLGRTALRQGAARWRDRAAGAATEGQPGTAWAASMLLSTGKRVMGVVLSWERHIVYRPSCNITPGQLNHVMNGSEKLLNLTVRATLPHHMCTHASSAALRAHCLCHSVHGC